LAVVFGKNERDDLTAEDRRAIAAIIGTYRQELEKEFSRGRRHHRGQDERENDG
jgi:hypothetical protein